MKFIGKISFEINIETLNYDKDTYSHSELLIYDNQLIIKIEQYQTAIVSFRMASLDYSKFGSLISYRNAFLKGDAIEMDFSKSELIKYESDTTNATCSFYIKEMRYSMERKTDKPVARFVLNDAGHYFIQDYYGNYFHDPYTLESNLPTRKNITHNVLDTICTPIFDFGFSDSIESREVIISKTPKIEWSNFNGIDEVVEYNQWICLLASFFFTLNIDYKSAFIDINDKRTIIRKVINTYTIPPKKSLLYFIGYQHIYDFFKYISFSQFRECKHTIEATIKRYLQSESLDGATKYLILYNILELCQEKKDIPKFTNIEKVKQIYKTESLNSILNSGVIIECEKNEFKKRWSDIWKFLQEKPSPNEMRSFLERKNLNFNTINNYITKEHPKETIISLRNCIVHGSSIHINEEINDALSLMSKIIILDLLGCSNVNISNILPYYSIYISPKIE